MCNDYGHNPPSQFSSAAIRHLQSRRWLFIILISSRVQASVEEVLYILWLFRHADSICLSPFCKVLSHSWPLLIRALVISALKSPLLGDFRRMVICFKSSRETFQQDWRPPLCILLVSFTRSLFLNGVPVCHYNTRELAGLMGNADKSQWWKHSQD